MENKEEHFLGGGGCGCCCCCCWSMSGPGGRRGPGGNSRLLSSEMGAEGGSGVPDGKSRPVAHAGTRRGCVGG